MVYRRLFFIGRFSCWLFSRAEGIWVAQIARLLMGLSAAFIFVSILALIRHWFPPNQFTLSVGLTETAGLVGVLTGNIALAAILHVFSWRELYLGLAGLIFIIGCAVLLFVRNYPDKRKKPIKKGDTKTFLKNLGYVLKRGDLMKSV